MLFGRKELRRHVQLVHSWLKPGQLAGQVGQPNAPSDSAFACHSARSNSGPRFARAASRPTSHARSPHSLAALGRRFAQAL